ncbi:MAG: hypothetical protein QOK34_899 [Gaiellaceae bacterium]|jgi:hypothetical protein|nr:hypothetical protein [Gaiellaceae bacterium]
MPAPSAPGAGINRPRVALSVSPARLAVVAPGSRRITVRNDGVERVAVVATTQLLIGPRRFVLASGKSASLTLRAGLGRNVEPGEHGALVLLTAHSTRGGHVDLQLRLGVRVRVRVPGLIVRRLVLRGVRVHHARGSRLVFVSVANTGNVTVQLRGSVTALLFRRGKRVGRLRLLAPRALSPGRRARLALRYSGRVRGPVTALVRVLLGSGVHAVERRYRIRL